MEFVNYLTKAEEYLGISRFEFCEAELGYRNTVKKVWVAKSALTEGHQIKVDDLIMKRSPNPGAQSRRKLIGKTVTEAIEEGSPVTPKQLSSNVLAIVVARMESSRLPRKAMLPVGSMTSIEHLLSRLHIAKSNGFIDTIAFCTTREESDDSLVELISEAFTDVNIYQGDTNNVLKECHWRSLSTRITILSLE